MSRIVILTEGKSNPQDGKTATGILRYRAGDVVAVLDSTQAGRTSGEVFGVGGDIPIVARLDEVEADQLLIGIAPTGGVLPESWRATIEAAIERGMEIVSGLHTFLGDDAKLAALAARKGTRIHDVRRPPRGLAVSKNIARDTRCFRVHTIGNDCGVGKLVASLEIHAGLRDRGFDSGFAATGQTGIMIAGSGLPIDAVVADFISGATESLVLADRDRDFCLIEGQGTLVHPYYSGVTLGLLHGCAPHAMVLVWEPTRATIRNTTVPITPVRELIELYERMAGYIFPSRVVAVALNTYSLDDAGARRAVDEVAEASGLPATDLIRFGRDVVLDAVLAERERLAAP